MGSPRLLFFCGSLLAVLGMTRAQVTVTWGGGNSNWATSGSWKDATGNIVTTVPGVSDHAQVASGTAAVSDARSAATLILSGGTLTVTDTLGVSGAGTFSGGTLNGSGTVNIGGLTTISGGTLGGGTLNANGGTAITGSFSLNNSHSLALSGSSTWSGGYVYAGGSSTLTNNSGATFTTNFDGTLYGGYWGGGAQTTVFVNNGTFTKSAGTGTTDIGAVFNNSGTLNVQTGTVQLDSGGTHTGTANLSANTTLNLAGGTHTFSSTATVTGNGTLKVSNGSATFSGNDLTIAAISVTGGTATFSSATNTGGGAFTTGALAVSGGTMTLGGSLAVTGTGALSGGTLNGGTTNFAGTLTLSGTTLGGGTTNANGSVAITNSFSLNNSHALTLAANSTWTNGAIFAGASSAITNNSGATLTTNFDGTLYGGYWGGGAQTTVFVNNGTFTKSAGTGTTDIGAVFNNSGTLNVQTGTVQLDSGGTHTGTANLSANTTLNLAGGTHTFSSTATVTGNGTLKVSNGSATFSGNDLTTAAISVTGGTATFSSATNTGGGAFTTGALAVSGGTMTLGGSLAVTGTGALSGGTLNGGTTTFAGTLTLSGTTLGGGTTNANGGTTIANSFSLSNAHALALNANSTWSGGTIYAGGGSAITNKSGVTLDNQFDGTLYGTYWGGGAQTTVFDNKGTFTKSAGTGTTAISAVFNNSGTLNVQTGTVQLDSGGSATSAASFNVASGATLKFSGGTYTLADGASLAGSGTLAVAGGTLTVTSGTVALPNVSISYGTLGGAGTATIPSFTQTGGSVAINTLSLTGTISWTGGNWNGGAGSTAAIASGSTLALTTSSNHDFDSRVVTNSGTVNWAGGYIQSGHGGGFINAGSFNDTQTYGYTIGNGYGGTAATFTNNGTYTRNGANATYVDLPFTNNGAVNVVAGDLQFRAGGSLTSSGTISAASGTNVYFTNGFSVANGTSLSGAGAFNLTNGTFDVAGSVTVGTFNQTGGSLTGTNTLSGTINWSGGDWNSPTTGVTTTLAAGATLNLGNGVYHDFNQRGIVNNGTVNWTSGYLRGGNGSTFTNAAGATFNDKQGSNYSVSNPGFGGTAGTFSFTNNGTYVRNGANATYYEVPFNNNGAITVTAGDLYFRAGGTMGAGSSVATASGTNVYFTTSYTIADGSSLTGTGDYWLTGGTLTVPGTLAASRFTQTNGVLAGTNTINGTFNWNGGDWNTTAAGTTTTIANGATLNLGNGGYHDFNVRSIVNNGTANWTSGYIRGGNGSVFTNNGTFNDLNASSYSVQNPSFNGTAGMFGFVNNGSYVRNAAGITYFEVPFTNNGSVDLQKGEIQFRGGGTLATSGSIAAAANTTVTFTNGYTVNNGASLSGAGSFVLTGGTMTLNGAVNVANFTQTGGNLSGTSTINGAVNWNGGNWNATAAGSSTTIASGGALNLGNGYHDFNYRTITNQGTTTWSSGYLRGGNGSVFTNAGTFVDANASSYSVYNPGSGSGFGGTFTFVNTGTYNRTASGVTYFDTQFDNSGTVNLTGGQLLLRGGGTMAATSVVNAAAGTLLELTQSYTVADGAQFVGAGTFMQTAGTLTLNGTLNATSFDWNGGDWNATANGVTTTIASGTTLRLGNGANHDFSYRNITNNGTVVWNSGYLRAGNGSVFTNAGTFNDQNVSGYTISGAAYSGTFTFTNTGTYNRSVAGTTYFDTTFNNAGTVNLTSGDLQVRRGGTMAATSVVSANAGTHFYFTNDYTIADGAQFAGAGEFVQTGGTLTLNGSLNAPAFNWNGGDWNAAASGVTTTIASGTTLNLGNNAYHDFNYRNITNNGIVVWSSGYIRAGNGSVFTNAGTFNDQNVSGYSVTGSGYGGSFTFANTGTYNHNAGGTTYFETTFNNSGHVNLGSGEIRVRGGGTMAAASIVNAAADSHFYFESNYTLLDGAQLRGAGVFQQVSGTLTIDGTLQADAFTWSGGNWNAANNSGLTTAIASGTTLNLTAANDVTRDFSRRTITNAGIVNWSAGYLRGGNGSSFVNNGTFNDQNASSYSVTNPWGGTFTVTNNGVYVKSTGGTTAFDVPFTNTGTLRVNGGILYLRSSFTNSGALYLANGATLQSANAFSMSTAMLAGTGTINASAVTAGGIVAPGTSMGTLAITGNLTLLNTSTLLIELGGSTQGSGYDFLNVGGTAALAGNLSVSFVNGFQNSIAPVQTFTIVTVGTTPSALTGAFANVGNGQRLFTSDGAGSFLVNYGTGSTFAANSVVLSNFVAVPEPSTYVLIGVGALAVFVSVRRRR